MVIWISLLGLALAAQPSDAAGKRQINVRASHFFAVDSRGPTPAFAETARIPYRPQSSCYHWLLEVEPEARTVALRELFELPAPAETWDTDPAGEVVTGVARDRASAVTEFEDSLADGLIEHGWCVAEGDPVGAHRIRVYDGERLLHEFNFEVVAETF